MLRCRPAVILIVGDPASCRRANTTLGVLHVLALAHTHTQLPDLKAHLDKHWDPVTRKPNQNMEQQYVPVPGM